MFAHWVLGWDFGGSSFFGAVAVSGVVGNDALVLLDRYNRIRRERSDLPAIRPGGGGHTQTDSAPCS